MTKLTQIIAGAASVALLASAAQAGSMTVKANDLDLSTPAGKQELDRRAEQAARAMCKGTYNAVVNCVPGAKAKIAERAAANGTVTIEKNGKGVTIAATPGAALAAN